MVFVQDGLYLPLEALLILSGLIPCRDFSVAYRDLCSGLGARRFIDCDRYLIPHLPPTVQNQLHPLEPCSVLDSFC